MFAGLGAAQSIPPSYGQPKTPQVVAYVERALQQHDLASAQAMAAQYRRLNGDTPEALEALSWVARGEAAGGQMDKAIADADDIEQSARRLLATRALDAEPQLPLALGASYEVRAQVMYVQGRRSEALQLLENAAHTWRGTSIVGRLEKNILLMTLEGHPLPALHADDWIGKKPAQPLDWHGKVVLLFFWAHWCSDCKGDAPAVANIARDLEPKGLLVIAPTRLYGYTAQDDNAAPAVEKPFIAKVFEHYYSAIPNAQIPLDTGNFERFGASTTPTLVVADKHGIVRLYHPGAMSESALRAAIVPLLGR